MTDDISDDIFDEAVGCFRTAIRNAALEEAAKVGDEYVAGLRREIKQCVPGFHSNLDRDISTIKYVCKAIRALKAGGG